MWFCSTSQHPPDTRTTGWDSLTEQLPTHTCAASDSNIKYKAHIELVPDTIYLHPAETKSVYKTVSCSFLTCELSSLKQTICFCTVLLRVSVWIEVEGLLYLLATVATNTEVCSLLPSEERGWKGEQRKPRNDPSIWLNSEIEGKTRHQTLLSHLII